MHPAPLVHTPTPHSPGPATVDLFAGAGGLSLGAQHAWPVTRAGFRAAVAWCEAANAELPVRSAVPCRRMRLR